MSVLSTKTKSKLSAKTAAAAVTNPGKTWLLTKAAKPVAKAGAGYRKALTKRRARRRLGDVGQSARRAGEILLVEAPEAAYELGLVERRAAKRTAPRVAVGLVIGAGAMYLLEPGAPGKAHRDKMLALVS